MVSAEVNNNFLKMYLRVLATFMMMSQSLGNSANMRLNSVIDPEIIKTRLFAEYSAKFRRQPVSYITIINRVDTLY